MVKNFLEAGGVAEDTPSLRFVLMWETDANDVDFHIYDTMGNHAFYSHPELETDHPLSLGALGFGLVLLTSAALEALRLYKLPIMLPPG